MMTNSDDLYCECGERAEMMTGINYCWVQCTKCPATGFHAVDYDTAAIYWDNNQYQYPPATAQDKIDAMRRQMNAWPQADS